MTKLDKSRLYFVTHLAKEAKKAGIEVIINVPTKLN